MADLTPEQKKRGIESMQKLANQEMDDGGLTEALKQNLNAMNPMTPERPVMPPQRPAVEIPQNIQGMARAKAMMGITPEAMDRFKSQQGSAQMDAAQKAADMAELSGDDEAQAKAKMQLEMLKRMRGY